MKSDADASKRREPPSYDLQRQGYVGISSSGIDDVNDIQSAKDFAEMIVDTIREGLLILTLDLQVKAANESFYRQFQTVPEETVGRCVYELGGNQWDIPELRTLLEDILPDNKVFDDYEVVHEFEKVGRKTMLLNARQLDDHQLILLAIEDVTERRETMAQLREREQALRELSQQLEARVQLRTQQVRELASTLTKAEQEERRRISRILHDDLQQLLYGVQLKLKSAEKDIRSEKLEALRERLHQADELLLKGVAMTRSLTVDLSPPILKHEGLTDALHWLKSHMKELHGLEVEFQAEHAFRTLDEDIRVLLFQVVKELLFNVAKHSGTSSALVRLRAVDHHLKIVVKDEGCGFDIAEARVREDAGGTFGLFSSRERVILFGGTTSIESAPGEGTQVTIELPLEMNYDA